MLYEWINTKETTATGSTTDFILDGSDSRPNATASDMIYANEVEDGSRAAGWYEIDGAEDLGNDNDTDWYFFKKGAKLRRQALRMLRLTPQVQPSTERKSKSMVSTSASIRMVRCRQVFRESLVIPTTSMTMAI